ncbi:hypothetical protein Baya_1557 [Bagarius yarrelli]|uniref:Uncharacterized protein n=1 Tax=Bagarius yarrelli TaxID=175774 RepID=A0A556TLI1_BAGYA|nr:hypothetical protein Baya_1557 [Bagarius yarrelli]
MERQDRTVEGKKGKQKNGRHAEKKVGKKKKKEGWKEGRNDCLEKKSMEGKTDSEKEEIQEGRKEGRKKGRKEGRYEKYTFSYCPSNPSFFLYEGKRDNEKQGRKEKRTMNSKSLVHMQQAKSVIRKQKSQVPDSFPDATSSDSKNEDMGQQH